MEKTEIVKNIVDEMLTKGFGGRYKAEYTEISPSEFKIDIKGEGVSYLIGQYGRTLLALQMLIRQMYMNLSGDYDEAFKIIIDIDGYKLKRIEKIKELAKKSAEKVMSLKQEITMPPMNAFERHVIHEFVQENFAEIVTSSIGEEPNRRVVLSPKSVN